MQLWLSSAGREGPRAASPFPASSGRTRRVPSSGFRNVPGGGRCPGVGPPPLRTPLRLRVERRRNVSIRTPLRDDREATFSKLQRAFRSFHLGTTEQIPAPKRGRDECPLPFAFPDDPGTRRVGKRCTHWSPIWSPPRRGAAPAVALRRVGKGRRLPALAKIFSTLRKI